MTNAGGSYNPNDLFIVKYDSNGNVLWAKKAGGSSNDYGKAITLDKNGDCYITGSFSSSSISFDGLTVVGPGSFIVKYNSLGVVQFVSNFGGSGISVDLNKNIYLTGELGSQIIFGLDTLNCAGAMDFFIAKYDSLGNKIWARRAGGTLQDYGKSIATDSIGNCYVAGSFMSPSMNFGGTVLTNNSGNIDFFIAKFNTNGNVIWVSSYGGIYNDLAYSICSNPAGDIYVTGSFDTPSLSIGSIVLTQTGSVFPDLYVAKFSSVGNPLWAKKVGGVYVEEGYGICVDNSDNIYTTGYFSSSLLSFDAIVLNSSNYVQFFVAKLGACPTPATTIISGTNAVCQGQNNVTYSCTAIPGVTSYIWTKPTGVTGTSTTNSISLNYGATAVSGNVTVKGQNTCGFGPLAILAVNVQGLPISAGVISGLMSVCLGQDSVIYSVPPIANATIYNWALPTGVTGTSTTNNIMVNIGMSAGSGNIAVFGSNLCGNGSSSTLGLVVQNSLNNAGAISGPTSVCQGQNSASYTTPIIAGANNYIWTLPTGATGNSNTNSITVNYGASAVSGNIVVKGNNACGDGGASTLAVAVNPMPPTPIITANGIILQSNSAIGNQWYNQNGIIAGATSQNYSPLANGNYYVIVTVNGCSSSASNTINITTVGVEQTILNNGINVYPNPVSNELTIEFKGNQENINFEIINSIGQVMYKGILTEKITVPTSNFATGVYLIKLENGTSYEFKKIVKD
ncbi:MAG: T9SS type A sorting domain-containing protein [Bacteroidetes bacterium]|nr:T9SS type A sorting domain-containing protein [Bacteroidota bacterium]